MDYRSGSQPQGTSPLKAAGLLVGLLVVVALAFALGMKAGHELDLLRGDEPSAPARVAERESRSGETERGTRAGAVPPKRADEGAPLADEAGGGKKDAGSTDGRHPDDGKANAPPAAPATAGGSSGAKDGVSGARSQEVAAPGRPETETAAKAAPAVSAPAVDYGIFRSAPGSSPTAKPSEAQSAGAGEPAAKAASAAKPPPAVTPTRSEPAKAGRESRDSATAGVKPAPAPTAKKPEPARDAATPTASKLTIAPEVPQKPAKADDPGAPGFVVQVAELASQAEAEQLVTRLKAHGMRGTATKVDLPAGVRYRVRVGRYQTMADAKASQQQVAAAGFAGSTIVSSR